MSSDPYQILFSSDWLPSFKTSVDYTSLHYTTIHYTKLHYTLLHYTALHYTTLHYTTLRETALKCTTLHCTTLNCTILYWSTLHYATRVTERWTHKSSQLIVFAGAVGLGKSLKVVNNSNKENNVTQMQKLQSRVFECWIKKLCQNPYILDSFNTFRKFHFGSKFWILKVWGSQTNIFYNTVHYTTLFSLNYTTRHYTTLHYTTLLQRTSYTLPPVIL